MRNNEEVIDGILKTYRCIITNLNTLPGNQIENIFINGSFSKKEAIDELVEEQEFIINKLKN